MTDADILDIAREMIFTIFKCAMPLLLVSLIVGLIISIFQTITSIQEQTLTFVPKLISIFLVLVIAGNWILTNIVEYMEYLFENFNAFIR